MKRTLTVAFLLLLALDFGFTQQMSKDERKNIERWTKHLKKGTDAERYEAAEFLRLYKYPEAVALLSQTLKDPSPNVRVRAALSLYEMKEVARPAIPALLEALKDQDAYVRINAGATLMNLDVPENQVLPAIEELLNHPDPSIQVAAVHFLQGNVPFEQLMPVLSSALRTSDPKVREEAAREFDDPKTLPAEALPILVGALNDPHAKVRYHAASAIQSFGTKGTAALPALLKLLKDPDDDVRFEAIDAIESMGTWANNALPALQDVIRTDRDAGNRRAAVDALDRIDPEGRTVVPMLMEALKDTDPEVREAAVDTFGSLRPFPYEAVPQMQSLIATEKEDRVKKGLERIVERAESEKTSSVRLTKRSDPPVAPKGVTSAMPAEQAAQILKEKGVQMTTDEFWNRVNDADVDVVKAMLSAGFSPNTVLQGMSVLSVATRAYDRDPAKKEIIRMLVNFGADVNYKDDIGTTPFFWAAGTCESDILALMIKHGAVLEVAAKGGATTLTEAAMANNVENVRLLFKSGYKLKNEPPWLINSTKNPEILALLRKAGVR